MARSSSARTDGRPSLASSTRRAGRTGVVGARRQPATLARDDTVSAVPSALRNCRRARTDARRTGPSAQEQRTDGSDGVGRSRVPGCLGRSARPERVRPLSGRISASVVTCWPRWVLPGVAESWPLNGPILAHTAGELGGSGRQSRRGQSVEGHPSSQPGQAGPVGLLLGGGRERRRRDVYTCPPRRSAWWSFMWRISASMANPPAASISPSTRQT